MNDFNVGPDKGFHSNFDLTNFIKKPTCFKNPENSSCINLILSKRPRSFQNFCAMGTGLSDFNKMTLEFWNYRHFQNNAFREDLLFALLNFNIEKSDEGFPEFFQNMRVL